MADNAAPESKADAAQAGVSDVKVTVDGGDAAGVSKGGAAAAATADDGTAKKEELNMVAYGTLRRYADGFDAFLLVVGIIGGIGGGFMMPGFSIIFGELLDAFDPANTSSFMDTIEKFSIIMLLVGAGAWVVSWLEMASFMISAERQVRKLREAYLRAILHQDIPWFDGQKTTELVTRINDEGKAIQEAMGEKAGMFIRLLAMFISGFVVGFVKSWQLTLVLLTMLPALAISGALMMFFMSWSKKASTEAYAAAGGVAEENLSAITTLQSLGGQKRVAAEFSTHIDAGIKAGWRKGLVSGGGAGCTMMVMFCCYALAFWYGSLMISDDRTDVLTAFRDTDNCPIDTPFDVTTICGPGYMADTILYSDADRTRCTAACNDRVFPCLLGTECASGGRVVMVFFAVLMASFAIGQAAPSATAVAQGRQAGYKVFETIDRKPEIDARNGGDKLGGPIRSIEFKDVTFRYPTRPDVKVLDHFSLKVGEGETVALVGHSGCGKSTVIQLLQRFYDCEGGQVLVNGKDVKTLDLKELRSAMGLVSQEPVLFAATVEENIRLGARDPSTVTIEDVVAAAKSANAHKFIHDEFPGKYKTLVGEGGKSCSGGQKQRIAIARAIIRKPSVLLADEATSALDSESERVVQEALDQLLSSKKGGAMQMSSIIIAHRLSSIQGADKIVVVNEGRVAESGTHNELKALGGIYAGMVEAQQKASEEVEGEGKVEDTLAPLDAAAAAVAERRRTLSGEKWDATPAPGAGGDRTRSDSRSRARTLSVGGARGEDAELDETDDPMDSFDGSDSSVRRIMGMMTPTEWVWFVFSCICAAINGAVMPVFALLFSKLVTLFYDPNVVSLKEDGAWWSLMFVFFAILVGVVNLVQLMGFEVIGEGLTMRIRDAAFKGMLNMDRDYHDRDKNNTGNLTTRLADESALIRGLAGERMALGIQNLFTAVIGLAISFEASWKLTLVVMLAMPLVAAGGAIQMKVFIGAEREGAKELEAAGHLVSESVYGIRTVSAFGLEDAVVELYSKRLAKPQKSGFKRGHVAGHGFGFSNFVMLSTYALAFWVGGIWVEDGDLNFEELMRVLMSLMMAAMGLGQTSAMMGDVQKAQSAAEVMFKTIDYRPAIDPSSDAGLKPDAVKGDIEFDDTQFTYPTRKSVRVLNGLKLKVKAGTTVAVVGSSGCGKSTVLQLLQRFYDPQGGSVKLDGHDLKDYNVAWLRSKIGVVSQEPVLFSTSVRDNIAFGAPEGTVVTEEAIIAAAKAANAHDFITAFPEGYDTQVGTAGTSLSGGQKQRIAIARAIIRNPSILILDEATSALDTVSERVVQDALDQMLSAGGRTSLIVAHRLSTIENADNIIVLDKGVVVQQGTHQELLEQGGHYADQWKLQQQRGADEVDGAGASGEAKASQ